MKLKPQASDYFSRGNVYFEKGDVQLAIDDYTKSMFLNPNMDAVYLARGKAYSSMGRFVDAISDFDLALRINPLETKIADELYFNRGAAHSLLVHDDMAISDFGQAIARNPYHAKAYCSRASIYLRRGNKKSACSDLAKAGHLFASMNDVNGAQEALRLLKSADAQSPHLPALTKAIAALKKK